MPRWPFPIGRRRTPSTWTWSGSARPAAAAGSALAGFLKQVLYKRPGRLVLKSPTHSFRLPILLEMFPEARFIHTLRNPYKVFASTVHLWKSLYAWQGYQQPTCAGLEEEVLRTFVRLHERLDATRGLVQPDRWHQVRFEDLLQDPVRQVRAIYERFGLGRFDRVEPAIGEYFQARANYPANRHELSPEWRAEVRRRWEPYFQRYGYSAEG